MSMALAALPAFSQDEQAKTSAGKPGQVVTIGKVTNFDVGKSIEVDAKGVPHKYDLNNADMSFSVSPEVATGMTVKITERTDANGHKTVTIEPSKKASE
jgi:hypothetical protein